MLYALAVIGRWFCPPKRNTDAGATELNQTKQPDGTTTIPTPPPNTPPPAPSAPAPESNPAPAPPPNSPITAVFQDSASEDDGTYSV